jgi:hypothetical protein
MGKKKKEKVDSHLSLLFQHSTYRKSGQPGINIHRAPASKQARTTTKLKNGEIPRKKTLERMAPILEKIMAGKEASPFILVKDTLEQSGQVLGLELLSNSPSKYVTSHCSRLHYQAGPNPI